jgi:hypothetical protein
MFGISVTASANIICLADGTDYSGQSVWMMIGSASHPGVASTVDPMPVNGTSCHKCPLLAKAVILRPQVQSLG